MSTGFLVELVFVDLNIYSSVQTKMKFFLNHPAAVDSDGVCDSQTVLSWLGRKQRQMQSSIQHRELLKPIR